ncbi:hypothetical protein [Luteimonas sp. MHLX1A]|uniref:hypothetical protein n=1 Tax=Alterluteimonas muca TaxID=2878684 RepID=UPI001E57D871|nr:hypothetical protein [Luteimonas sp. MHLX1A]MCD9045618.1 hypothetical protein [Luteimonas sp. MHLX1A]
MSRFSKARRDARRKDEPARPIRRLGDPLRLQARLAEPGGETVAAAALRDGEWLLLLDGRTAARTDSAAMVLAMLRHIARRHATGEAGLQLRCSPQLRAAAADEAAAHARTLTEHLDALEAERQTRHVTVS